MIREFKEEIERLRKLLSEHTSAGGGALPAGMMSALLGEGGGAAAASTAAPSSTTATADSIDKPSQQAPAPQQQQAQRQSAEFASPIKRIQEVSSCQCHLCLFSPPSLQEPAAVYLLFRRRTRTIATRPTRTTARLRTSPRSSTRSAACAWRWSRGCTSSREW